MSHDTWDGILDSARAAGTVCGITVGGWGDVPSGDADQMIREAAEAYVNAAEVAFRTRRPAMLPPQHYHDTSGMEDTPCRCPSPGTYAPQWPGEAQSP